MTRLLKWLVLPAVVIAGMVLAAPGAAQAQGFGVTVYRSYGPVGYSSWYGPRYSYYGVSPYGPYGPYGAGYAPYYRSGYTSFYVAPPIYRPYPVYRPYCGY